MEKAHYSHMTLCESSINVRKVMRRKQRKQELPMSQIMELGSLEPQEVDWKMLLPDASKGIDRMEQ